MPPVTVRRTRSSKDLSRSIARFDYFNSSEVEKRTSISACASAATTFDRVPPSITPTLIVIPPPRSLSAYKRSICLASSRMALAPFSGSKPAWAARPSNLSVNMPVPLRPVFTPPPGTGGSRTNPHRTVVPLASFSNKGQPEKLPTSSSQVKANVTPPRGTIPKSSQTCSTATAIAQFAFMSKMPGP